MPSQQPEIKIPNSKEFSKMVVQLQKELKVPMMDTVIHYCDRNGIEIQTVAKLLNAKIKAQIQEEAEDLHFLEKTSRLDME